MIKKQIENCRFPDFTSAHLADLLIHNYHAPNPFEHSLNKDIESLAKFH